MIDVTSRAANQIRSLLKQSRAPAGHVLRLSFDGKRGLAMGLGQPAGDDVVIGDADGPVLAIPPQLAQRLDGLVFDWIISEAAAPVTGCAPPSAIIPYGWPDGRARQPAAADQREEAVRDRERWFSIVRAGPGRRPAPRRDRAR